MEPQKFSQKQLIAIGVAIVVIIILAVGYWYVSQKEEVSKTSEETNQALEVFSESVVTSEDVISNPIENKIPELNPVEKTNPYKEYKNPFE